MKVLYIVNGNGLNPSLSGSICRSIEVASRIKKKGCEVYFLTTIGGFKACQSKGVDFHSYLLPASIFKKNEKGILDRIIAYVISTIVAFFIIPRLPKCDLVYSDSDYFCDVIPALFYKKIKKAKWVAMTHHIISISKKRLRDFVISFLSSGLQLFSYFLFQKYADAVFVYKSPMGEEIANYLISKRFRNFNIYKVNNGIDFELIQKISPADKIYDACFVGGLRPSKGIYDIVPIWKRVLEKRKDAVLVIVGGGLKEYENEFKVHVQMERLNSQIKIVGAKNHEETIKIMKQSRVFIAPSHEEGWGIAICEALACGLPVITYDLPVYKTIFRNIISVTPLGNFEKFADFILQLLSDKELETMKKERCIMVAKQYDWDLVAKNEMEIFETLLEK